MTDKPKCGGSPGKPLMTVFGDHPGDVRRYCPGCRDCQPAEGTPPERGDEGEAFAAVMAGSLGPAIAHVGLFTKEAAPLLRAFEAAAEARGREQGHLEGYTYGHEVGKREGAERRTEEIADWMSGQTFTAQNGEQVSVGLVVSRDITARFPAHTDEERP